MLILRSTHERLPPMPAKIPATLIPGDGIGPEIMDAALAALEALGAPFEWDRQVAGLEGVKAAGDPLPPRTLDSIRRTHLALKGPLETPSGGGYRSSNVRLREEFKLYANLRPARTPDPRRPLRQHRSGGRARESRRPVHRPRALHPNRRRSARGRHGHRRQHAPGQPPPAGIRLRVRRRHRAQEGDDRAQGQHHEGAHRHLSRDGPGAVRAQSTRAVSSSTP